jgi:signal transduction histidine kinase
MARWQPSIRGKITLGYYFGAAAIIGLSVFSLIELWHLDRRIIFGDVIAEFFDTTLEIRRFEKNFFLYEKEEDYRENIRYVTKAESFISDNTGEFSALMGQEQLGVLRADLAEYRHLMEQLAGVEMPESARRAGLGIRIREIGKEIVTIAEDVSRKERRNLQQAIRKTRDTIVILIAVLSVAGIVVGQLLSRIVVGRLKALERSMEKVAAGGFEKIVLDSQDREIVSLTAAFNKMLRELEMRQRHIVQSEKLASLGTLMAGIAHEINNPLSNISTSCQILQEEMEAADPAFRKEMLSQIEEQTDRARNIVRSLLDFSRERKFTRETLPLEALVEDTIKFIKAHLPARVSVSLDIPGDLTIFADKQRMQQVFLNLLKNAAEAISGEGTIRIAARRHLPASMATGETSESFRYASDHARCIDGGATVDITVRDTGQGMPREMLPRIFDPFFTTKDVGKGSGLGLSIVHEIIEEHGGCIAVDSEPGKGTTFLIRLPAKE